MTLTKNVDRDSLKCICEGNWRHIIAECEHLMGQTIYDRNGDPCTFLGVIHCEDDYYYVASNQITSKTTYYSCVGDLDTWDFTKESSKNGINDLKEKVFEKIGYTLTDADEEIIEICYEILKSEK